MLKINKSSSFELTAPQRIGTGHFEQTRPNDPVFGKEKDILNMNLNHQDNRLP